MQTRGTRVLLTMAFLMGGASAARANLITNGSFETGNLSGWTASGNVQALNFTNWAQDGIWFADFNGGDGPTNGALSQSVSVLNGSTYNLSFYFRKGGTGSGTAALDVSVTGAGTLVSATVSDSVGSATGGWDFYTYQFTADSSSISLSFTDQSNATIGMDALLDNVVLVPEPSTALLLCLGLLAFVLRARR